MSLKINNQNNYNKSILVVLITFCIIFFALFGIQWYQISENIKEYKLEKTDQLNKLEKSKTNLIDINKLEKSKNYIVIKKEDLESINGNINQLAEEIYSEKNKATSIIDKDIDRINLYMAIGIGFFSIIGIFVPLVINYLSHDDLKEKLKELQLKTQNLNSEELDKAVSNANEALSKSTEIDVISDKLKEVQEKTKDLNNEELEKAIKNANEALSKSAEIDGIKDNLDDVIPKVSTISLQIALNRINNMTSIAIKNIRLHKDNKLFNELFNHLKDELNKCKEDKNHSISENKPLIETLKDFVQMFNDEKIRFVSILNKKGLDLEFDNLTIRLKKLINSKKEDEDKIYEEITSTIDNILEIFKK